MRHHHPAASVCTLVTRVARRRFVLLASVLVGAAACADSVAPPPSPAVEPDPPSFTSYDAASRTLGVSITASSTKFTQEGPATATANVTGGSGNYYYVWYIGRATAGGVKDFYLYDQGWGMNTIQFYVYPDETQVVVRLSVGDDEVPVWAGNYRRSILGPAAVNAYYAVADMCINYDPGYHFDDYWAPDGTHKSTWYLDVCRLAKIFDLK